MVLIPHYYTKWKFSMHFPIPFPLLRLNSQQILENTKLENQVVQKPPKKGEQRFQNPSLLSSKVMHPTRKPPQKHDLQTCSF